MLSQKKNKERILNNTTAAHVNKHGFWVVLRAKRKMIIISNNNSNNNNNNKPSTS